MTVYSRDPSIVIQVGVEERAPVVFIVASTKELEGRIVDWVRSQDELAELVERALEIRDEARAT